MSPQTKLSSCLVCIAVLLIVPADLVQAAEPQSENNPPRTLRILFVGNSYTSVNDLPKLVATLCRAADRKISVTRALRGGATLQQHADAEASRKIGQQPFDIVVMQEQSQLPLLMPQQMHEASRKLHAQIIAENPQTRIVFYQTWARRDRPEDQAGISLAYRQIATELKAEVAPVGDAWALALAAGPQRKLHMADGSHPNAAGSYLAACVLTAVILQRNPGDLPAVNISAAEATRLQELAAKAMHDIVTPANVVKQP